MSSQPLPDPPCAHGLTGGRGAAERCLECGASVTASSPDERLREAVRDANEYLAQIADYSPSEVADAIDSVRAQIKDAGGDNYTLAHPVAGEGQRIGLITCLSCGVTLTLDRDVDVMLIHDAWHRRQEPPVPDEPKETTT